MILNDIEDFIIKLGKAGWVVFTTILGIIVIITMVAEWLGFFGIIPYGNSVDDTHSGRYTDELNSPFYPLR